MPRWTENDGPLLKYVQAMVAVSPPSIKTEKQEFEFEDSLVSNSLIDIKKSKRHIIANELLLKDPMFVVPRD